jgi:hypothetical protein
VPGLGSAGLADVLLGLALGAAFGAYAVLQPQTVGFGFPNLNAGIAMRPTIGRMAIFLLGRWLGFLLLGLFAGWLHLTLGNFPVGARLLLAAEILLAVFMLLFLLTGYAPELKLAQWLDPAMWSLPLGIKGLISSWAVTAPAAIALCYVFLTRTPVEGMLYFTNVFLGNALVLLPLILNIPWVKANYYQIFARLIILLCSIAVVANSIYTLLKS